MRVEAYSKINQIYQTKQKSRTQATVKSSGRDELTISSTARDYQVARQALANMADIREDKVTALKSSIDSGNYQVSADSFAAKVIAKYEEMTF